jgi:hypothetical protein
MIGYWERGDGKNRRPRISHRAKAFKGAAMQRHTPFVRWVGIGSCVFALASCGGGGGGGDGGGNESASGMIPAPGPLGAVLYDDATTLRPLVAGGKWTYRGHDVLAAGQEPTIYANVVTQTASAAGFVETATNVFNDGADTATISVSNRVVLSAVVVDLPSATGTAPLTTPELRSPVRQNDQITVMDQHIADVGSDVDGDGKNDAADVAIYRVVVGAEDVAPENLPVLHAVRVDTIGLVRFTLSSDGSTTAPVQAALQSTWYARGIGVVRQKFTTPNAIGNRVTDELITSYDGLTQGFGAMPAVAAVVPASSPVTPGANLGGPDFGYITAIGMADHALVFATDVSGTRGTIVSRMDMRGNVLDTHLLSNVSIFLSNRSALVGHPAGVVAVGGGPSIGNTSAKIALTRFDVDGALIGTPGDVTMEAGGGRFLPVLGRMWAASDGQVLWILWVRTYVDVGIGTKEELVLGRFDFDGNALAPETIVETGTTASESIAAGAGSVVVTWSKADGAGTYDLFYASATRASPTLSVRTFAPGLAVSDRLITPTVLDEGGALLWNAGLNGGGLLTRTAGVRLDASFAVLRSNAAGLDTELLGGMSIAPAVLGNRIVLASPLRGLLWADDSLSADQFLETITWLDANAGPLASVPSKAIRFATGGSQGSTSQVVWPDRVLVFGGATFLKTTVVWLNSGG